MASAHLTKLKRKATELEQKKQFEKALALYIQVIDEAGRDLDDADLQLYNRVGDLLMRQNNVSEALAYYEKAVDMYAERGFLNNAIALCNKILRQSPARTTVYYKLGKISASKGFKSDARKNFLEYADRMQKGGNLDEAFRALKEFADLCPDQDDIRLMLADLLTRENRTTEAVEQLEQLYHKLDAEGRTAEARATMDRIKAIDPEIIEPRATGSWQAQKSNDLVYLDLGDAELKPAAGRAPTPRDVTPATAPLVMDTVDVSGVAALQGLAITFLPDDSPAPDPVEAAAAPAIEGLEVSAEAPPDLAIPTPHVPDLETAVSLTPVEVEPIPVLPVDHPEFETPDDVVPPEVGIESSVVTLTGAHPSLAPLIDEPPMTGAEFGSLHLDASHDAPEQGPEHDLAIESSLPLLDLGTETPSASPADPMLAITAPGLLDSTPDAWVDAALQAPRDDFSFDRLLTPLDNQIITPAPEMELAPAEELGPGVDAEPRVTGSFTVDELLALPEPDAPGLEIEAVTPIASDALPDDAFAPATAGDDTESEADVLDASPAMEPEEPAGLVIEAEPVAAEDVASAQAVTDTEAPPAIAHDELAPAEDSVSDATLEPEPVEAEVEVERTARDQAFEEREAAADDASVARPGDPEDAPSWPTGANGELAIRPTPVWSAESDLPPEFALEGGLDEAPPRFPTPSVLDTAALRAEVERELREEAESAAEAAPVAEPGIKDARAAEPGDQVLRSAFEEDRVELPLLDLEASTWSEEPAVLPGSGQNESIDDLLSAPPSFGDGAEAPPTFEPAPLDLGEEGTDEWATPEVLIDGEWRDEHVGDLVSGEMFVVGERRDADRPRAPQFDDLAAAMLYPGDDDAPLPGERAPAPSAPMDFVMRPHTPRGTVSFGGMEAQLRRRLEINPSDTVLRRQLGEALLDTGDREGGLNELEVAVREYEAANDLPGAREVVDVILRVVPLSVRHHQKRVEYAVRASDRPRLIEAYTELADALFRCGEPDKARVVYSRVLELAPQNERARFALSMLADDAGLPRQSDEIPTIDTGILRGTPSVTMATLTPEELDALTSHDVPPGVLPSLLTPAPMPEPLVSADAFAPAPPVAAPDALVDEVDAAFAAEPGPVREARRRTEELVAVEEWAATQPPREVPPTPPSGEFIDLGDWLRSTEPERNTRMVAADVAPTGDEGADFAEMLRRFKAGIAENVDEEDYAAHYDLGVAYKEMGLVDEAIAEFQKSLRGEGHRIPSYEALGQCFVEKGQFQVAIALLRRAIEAPGVDDQRLVGVLYLLGFASESVGRQDDAVGYYQRVFAVDIQFRDVSTRLAALGRDAK